MREQRQRRFRELTDVCTFGNARFLCNASYVGSHDYPKTYACKCGPQAIVREDHFELVAILAEKLGIPLH